MLPFARLLLFNYLHYLGFSGSSSNPCGEIFRGLSAADQAETQSVVKKLASIANQTKLFITLHSYGQLILTPYGFQRGLHPANYDELVRTIYFNFKMNAERIVCNFVPSTQHDLEFGKHQFAIYPKSRTIHTKN